MYNGQKKFYASGNRSGYANSGFTGGNFRYNGNSRGNFNNNGGKPRSGAKFANVKDGRAISAWKASRYGLVTFFASLSSGKSKMVTGRNGREYLTSVPVKVFNKDTMQTSWTWGIWAPDALTLTCDKIGMYICLKQGGFVGRIKR